MTGYEEKRIRDQSIASDRSYGKKIRVVGYWLVCLRGQRGKPEEVVQIKPAATYVGSGER